MPESKIKKNKKNKNLWSRFMDWIARGTRQAEKKGQGPCRS